MPHFSPSPLGRSTTVDRVAGELRRAVFDGELEAGAALREVALADSLGVSRPTVRAALAELVAEGIATRHPHRGVYVARPDPTSIADVSRARAVLELAGVQAWRDADDTLRESLRVAVAEYQAAVADGASYQELNEHHLRVHLALVGLTGSLRLVATAAALTSELKVALAAIDRDRHDAHDQADSHLHLLKLLEEGRVDAAHVELVHHLAGAQAAIVEALGLEADR